MLTTRRQQFDDVPAEGDIRSAHCDPHNALRRRKHLDVEPGRSPAVPPLVRRAADVRIRTGSATRELRCGVAMIGVVALDAAAGLSLVLMQTEDIAVGVGDGGDETAATNVVRGLLNGGARSGQVSQLRLDVRHRPVGHR